jgi:hypothetical protein
MKMVPVLAPPLVHPIQINPKGEDSPPLSHPILINLKSEDSRLYLYLFMGFTVIFSQAEAQDSLLWQVTPQI